jgi:hypothetical protein
MTSLLWLQIIAPLALIYGIKSKMWITDTISFVIICSVVMFLVLVNFIDEWLDFHMLIINLIIIFIVIYHHFHKVRFYCQILKEESKDEFVK